MPALGRISSMAPASRAAGWFGLIDYLNTEAYGEPLAAWFHGTDYPALEGHDYAGLDHDLWTRTGAHEAGYLAGGDQSFATAPMTPSEVLAYAGPGGVAGEMTLVSVVKVTMPAVSQGFVGDYVNNARPAVLLGCSAGGTYRLFANAGDGGTNYVFLNTDGSSGAVYEMLAGRIAGRGISLHRRLASHAADSAVSTLSHDPAGPELMRIGRSYGGAYNNGCAVAATLIFPKAISNADLTNLRADLQAFFADKMPSINWN